MPIIPKLSFNRGGLGSKIENPAGDEATEDGYVCDDYGDVVLDVADTVVDWICPVRLEVLIKPVAVREVDFYGADSGDTITSLVSRVQKSFRLNILRQACSEDCEHYQSGP